MRIDCHDLVKDYSRLHAVNCVSIGAEEGRVTCVIGKSGAGKSTLIRLLSLLEKADGGEVMYDGERVDNLKRKDILALRKQMGMIFQSFNLFSSRNVIRNVTYPLEVAKVPRGKAFERAMSLLDTVGLAFKAHDSISSLSGGQKQRVAIARALALEPKVLFCDEATSALDPQSTKEILGLIKEIQRRLSLTVIMVTHQMEVVKSICDYLVVMDEGKVIEEGNARERFANPRSAVLSGFLRDLVVNSGVQADAEYYLRFSGETADMPILSMLSRKCGVDFNIRGGGIRSGSESSSDIGGLYVDIIGDARSKAAALDELARMSVSAKRLRSQDGQEGEAR